MRRRRIISLKLRRRVTKNLRVFLLYCRTWKKQLPKAIKSISIFSRKTWTKRFAISALIVTIIASSFTFFKHPTLVLGQTYNITQNDWSGGADPGTVDGPANLTGHNKYESATGVTAGAGSVALTPSQTSFTETFANTNYKDTANTTASWTTSGELGVLPITSYSLANISSKMTDAGIISPGIYSMYKDVANNVLYLAGGMSTGPFLAMYNISTNTVTDLTVSSGLSTMRPPDYNNFRNLAMDGNRLYFNDSYNDFLFFDTTTGLATDLTDVVAYAYSGGIAVDQVNHKIYIGSSNGYFAVYTPGSPGSIVDLSSTISGFWGSTYGDYVSKIVVNPIDKKIYLAGGAGQFAVYDPASGTATNLAVTSGLSAFWGTSQVNGFVFCPLNNKMYLTAGGNGQLVSYVPETNTATDIYASAGFTEPKSLGQISFDPIDNKLYFGSYHAFYSYRPDVDGSLVDLFGVVPGLGVMVDYSYIGAPFVDPEQGKLYFGAGNSFGVITIGRTATTASNLSSAIMNIWGSSPSVGPMAYDTANNVLYLGNYRGDFAKYDIATGIATNLRTSSGLGAFWSGRGYSQINAITYNPINGKIYLGGSSGLAAVYTPGSPGTATNLTTVSGLADFWDTNSGISSIVVNSVDNKVYFSGDNGMFAVYTPGSPGTATNLTSVSGLSAFWGSTGVGRMIFDNINNKIYLGGDDRFAVYTPGAPGTATDIRVTSGLNNYIGAINTMVFDSVNGKVYMGGYDGAFVVYTPGTPGTAAGLRDPSGLGAFWPNGSLTSMVFDAVNAKLYLGSNIGRFAVYTPGSPGVAKNLYNTTGVSSICQGNGIDLQTNAANNKLYLACNGFVQINILNTPKASSLTFDSTAQNITSATLTKHDTPGTGLVTYLLSNNGGATYNTVTPGSLYTFSSVGTDLRFKIYIDGNATVQDISIAYNYYSASGELVSSKFDAIDPTNIVNQISWNENASLPSGARTVVSMRTAGTANGLDSTPWINFSAGQPASAPMAVSDTFTTTTNRDAANTTATWNTSGELVSGAFSANDITSVLPGILSDVRVMGMDRDNRVIYFGDQGGHFARYNIVSNTAEDLTTSSGLSEFWVGGNIGALAVDQGKVYLLNDNGDFAVYDPTQGANGTATSLARAWGYYMAMDTVNHMVYIGSGGGGVSVYDTNTSTLTSIRDSSGLSAFWGTAYYDQISAIEYDGSGRVYIGSLNGKFAYFNTTNNVANIVAHNLADMPSYSFWGTMSIKNILHNPSDGKIYFTGNGHYFAAYTPGGAVVDIATSANMEAIPFSGSNLEGLTRSADGRQVFITDSGAGMFSYDTVTGTAASAGYLGAEVAKLEVDEINGRIYGLMYGSRFNYFVVPCKTCVATSLPIDSASGNIFSATLTKNDTPGTGTVTYQLSNNGGTNWETVTPGSLHAFSSTGSDLRFKIIFTGNATIQDVSIEYYSAVPGSTNCTKSGTTVTCGAGTVPASFQDGSGDRFFQYKITLVSDGTNTPTITSAAIQFVVNAAPEVRNVTAVQNANGTVTISYETRDIDTAGGTPGNIDHVHPSFEYWNGTSYQTITTLAAGDTDPVTVPHDGSWNNVVHTATWTPSTDYPGHWQNNTARIRVTANDNEGANPTGSAESTLYSLDTKIPASVSLTIDASASTPTAHLAATEDNVGTMKVSITDPTLATTSSEPFATTKTLSSLAEGNTVYARITDAFNNSTNIMSAPVPVTPTAVIIQDISNVVATPNTFRLFLAWKATTGAFASYRVHRSTTNSAPETWAEIASIGTQSTNYYVDNDVAEGDSLYYYVTAVDSAGNISFRSSIVHATANGTQDAGEGGGGTAVAPVITAVSSGTPRSTQATITWATDVLSDSVVEYSTSPSTFTSSAAIDSLVDNASGVGIHSVILSGLSPETQYYFRVSSTDINGRATTDANGGTGYTFMTAVGPTISAVTISNIKNTTAHIAWTTNTSASTEVRYSTNYTLSGSTSVVSEDPNSTTHSIDITGLNPGTVYYFEVRSVDGASNETIDNNVIDGTIHYYTFTTANDLTAPVIGGVTTTLVSDTSAVITWGTDEPSTSQVLYGTTTAYGSQTAENPILTITHSVTIMGLTASTSYVYEVRSADTYGNIATNDNTGTGYSFTTAATPGVAAVSRRPEVDRTPPIIMNVRVGSIGKHSVRIEWTTDEAADTIVKYGKTVAYGSLAGSVDEKISSHQVDITDLTVGTVYHFIAVSSDGNGNQASTTDRVFATLNEDGTIIPVPAQPEETTPPTVTPPATEPPKVEEPEVKKPGARDLFQTLLESSDLSSLPEDYFTATVNELIDRVMRAPSIVGPVPKVDVAGTKAVVSWTTDKKSNGSVFYTKDADYSPNAKEPYLASFADPTSDTTTHAVTIEDLTPATTYHFQVRSKGLIGGEARSQDATFVTASELPQITDLSISKVSDLSAVLTWKTNIPTKTDIEYKNLVSGTALTQGDPALLRDHKFTLDKLESGAPYTVVITATDENGGKTQSKAINLSTSKDGEGPVISRIKSESTLYPGKESRVQTIVSWTTDEPSTSLVYYQEGLSGDAATTEMPVDSVLTTSHTVVITKFRPATVYKIRVESTDSSGNVTKSNDVMVLTPQQKASVLDMIIKNFEQVFGWTKKI